MATARDDNSFISYEGTVTSVNESFCQFTMDNKYHVLVCDIFEMGKRGLPKLNEKITIKHILLLENNFMHLNKGSEVICSGFDYPEKSERFCWEYEEEHNFNFKDIQLIQKTVDRFRKLNIFNSGFIQSKTLFQTTLTVDDIFLNVYSHLPRKYARKKKTECNFNDFDFVFPYKFDAAYPEVCTQSELEELTYTFQNNNDLQIFIGYLTYDETLYTTVLVDAKFQVMCKIITNGKPLQEYMNEFIIIKKYCYVGEYYKEISEKLDYLLFALDNVQVLKLEGKIIDCQEHTLDNHFIVLHKGPVYFHNFKNKFEIWLYVEFPNNKFNCFVSSLHFGNIYHLINVGSELKVNIPENINIEEYLKNHLFTSNYELNRACDIAKAYMLPTTMYVQINQQVQHVFNIRPMADVLPLVKPYDTTPVSFIARIQSKGLSQPLSSRTASVCKRPMFGTPGTKTHFLRLEDVHNKSCVTTLYLNNMENSLCPIGLVPGMEVYVRFAIPQNKYLKSCMMTYVEPVEMTPCVNTRFDFSEDWDWGAATVISDIQEPSSSVRLWGRIITIEIVEITFVSNCLLCKRMLQLKQKSCCDKTDLTHSLKLKFNARDEAGFSVITTDNVNVFTRICGVDEKEAKMILEIMSNLRQYKYRPGGRTYKIEKVNSTDTAVYLNEWLHWFFTVKSHPIKSLDLRVKRSKNYHFTEKWYCAEARRTINGFQMIL